MVVWRSVGGEMTLFESHDLSGVELLRQEFSPSHERSALWGDLLGLLARAVRFPLGAPPQFAELCPVGFLLSRSSLRRHRYEAGLVLAQHAYW